MSLQLMKKRIKSSALTERETIINESRNFLANKIKGSICYNDYITFWIPENNQKNGEKVDINLYNWKHSSISGNTVEFQTPYNQRVEIGDYLYNHENNTYWICTEAFNIDNVHYRGKLTECNWFLKWQRKDGIILQYPCFCINATQYNSGESSDKTLTLGSAQHMATVQATEDTINIKNPQRFYISKTNSIPFIVTQNDTTTYNYGKGLCKITLTQDTNRNDKDRPDLGICDYIESFTPLPPAPNETKVLSAIINGNPNLKIGFPRTYSITFTDNNGNDVTDCDYNWNIVSNFPVTQIPYTNTIELQVDDEDYIGSSFLLQAIVNNKVIAKLSISVIEII